MSTIDWDRNRCCAHQNSRSALISVQTLHLLDCTPDPWMLRIVTCTQLVERCAQ
jgi:hypothetical protein